MRYMVIFSALILMIASCTSAASEATPNSGPELNTEVTPTENEIINPTTPPSQTPTANAQATKSVLPTPLETPLPQFQLCSPLSLHPLEELLEIVGDPYDPPRPGREERHHGIDFAYYHYEDRDSMLGEPVQAVLSGVVASVLEDLYPYGNMLMVEIKRTELPDDTIEVIEIAAGESLYILYAHLFEPPLIELGDRIDACQQIGEVGMSGNTDIPHLHLETRVGPEGQVFESMRFYDTRASQEEMDNYVLWRTSDVFRHFDPLKLFGYGSEEIEGSPVPEENPDSYPE
jgi:murein DD-endopeptidase MepM/ murein hydrolase activator NlpD